jgi:hypothetical protein
MQLDKYDFQANETFVSFAFNSIGPKGVIKKVVNYQLLTLQFRGLPVVNLAFGDWNEEKQKVDDSTISNNNDREKVLATVASTLLVYMEKYGRRAVFARGITPAKTRLYQMGINAQRIETEKLFEVYGLFRAAWVPFEPGHNFDAFLVIKK